MRTSIIVKSANTLPRRKPVSILIAGFLMADGWSMKVTSVCWTATLIDFDGHAHPAEPVPLEFELQMRNPISKEDLFVRCYRRAAWSC